ncbi:MAG TPA: sulfur transferase domain-containing protein [Pseudoxanthomonas sp.]|nr:sulfur transferase domain-containing protein [Pseudoxanthomonas sp.]
MLMRHRIQVIAAALLLAATSAWAGEFSQPRPGLHTGGQPSEAQLSEFSKQGVKTVIDLRGTDEDRGYDEVAATQRLGLRYERLPIAGADDLTPANAARLKQLLASGGNQVLLHCASGNRVGALLALMAQQEEGASREQALELGKAAGMKSLTPVVEKQLQP